MKLGRKFKEKENNLAPIFLFSCNKNISGFKNAKFKNN